MKITIAFIIAFAMILTGCADTKNHSKGVYMLLDISDAYTLELKKAQSILNYLLGELQPHDTLAVASIDTPNFSEKDIIAKVTFYQRPSVANNQKRAFQMKINKFISNAKSSRYTDISGGISQAIEYLNDADPGRKYILIFSDLMEKIKKGHTSDVRFQLAGFQVIVLNANILSAQIRDPKQYLKRVERWRAKVEDGYGKWRFVHDIKRLENIFAN